MTKLTISQQARGTQILLGSERRRVIELFRKVVESCGFQELILPTIEPASIYHTKLGDAAERQMWLFPDKKGREMCLRPEGTATCQLLAQKYQDRRDWCVWYEARCFRYERPQAGRYREFTQLGVEVLNPKRIQMSRLIDVARLALEPLLTDVDWRMSSAQRGLAYYVGDGFEAEAEVLGAQKQVLGGGRYPEGFGFAIGLDRVLLARSQKEKL